MSFQEKAGAGAAGQGRPLVGTLRGAARVAVSGYLAGAARAGRIAAADHDVLIATHGRASAASPPKC